MADVCMTGKTEDLYNSNSYVALMTEHFFADSRCFAQLKIAVDRKLPAFFIIKNNVEIPKEFQEMMDLAKEEGRVYFNSEEDFEKLVIDKLKTFIISNEQL